jgi:hypothetical protein
MEWQDRRRFESWYRKVERYATTVHDHVNAHVLLRGVLMGRLGETGIGEALYRELIAANGNGRIIGKSRFFERLGTIDYDFYDGEAILHVAAVAVAEKDELGRYLAADTYRKAHPIALQILGKRHAIRAVPDGNKGKTKYVLIPFVLERYIR